MADDEAQGPEDTAWGAVDASPDPGLPSVGFDEPLVWPEWPVWDDDIPRPAASDATGADGHIILPPLPTIAPVATVARTAAAVDRDQPRDPAPSADPDAQWRPTEDDLDPDAPQQHSGPLAGLGGGSGAPPAETGGNGPAPTATDGNVPTESAGNVPWPVAVDDRPGNDRSLDQPPPDSPALGSIWSNDLRADPQDLAGFGGLAAPAIYAENERSSRGLRRRLDVRPGNAAVIGLISVVSLVLLGMFLSVRARNNDVPTDASQTRPAGDQVAVTGPLNTIPAPTTVTTTTTTTVPEPSINLSDLVAATEATAVPTGSGTSATTTPSRTSTATPTASGSATTTPVTQATATTAPPTTEATTPPATAPVEEETSTTVRRPPISITIPTFTIPTTSFTIPPRTGFPGLSRTDD